MRVAGLIEIVNSRAGMPPLGDADQPGAGMPIQALSSLSPADPRSKRPHRPGTPPDPIRTRLHPRPHAMTSTVKGRAKLQQQESSCVRTTDRAASTLTAL